MKKTDSKEVFKQLLKGKSAEERKLLSQLYVTQLRGILKTVEYLTDYLSIDEYQPEKNKMLFDNWRQEAEKKARQMENLFSEMKPINENEVDFLLQGSMLLTLVDPKQKEKGMKAPFFYDLEKVVKRSFPPKTIKSGEALIKHLS
jgi:cupin superfamily acireductone dioxygenase involved in methionine salvage